MYSTNKAHTNIILDVFCDLFSTCSFYSEAIVNVSWCPAGIISGNLWKWCNLDGSRHLSTSTVLNISKKKNFLESNLLWQVVWESSGIFLPLWAIGTDKSSSLCNQMTWRQRILLKKKTTLQKFFYVPEKRICPPCLCWFIVIVYLTILPWRT